MSHIKTKYSNRFSSFSVILVFVALCIMGLSLLPLIHIQLNPSHTTPSLTVNYNWPNASSRSIEQKVTSKLEGALSGIEGIKETSSVSYRGKGKITIAFKKQVNMDMVRFEASTIVRRVYPKLPEEVSYPQLSLSASGGKKQTLMTYTLSAPSPPLIIQQHAEENIVPKLSILSGINDVSVYGATPFEWRIMLNKALIQQLGVSVPEVAWAINSYFRKDVIGTGVTLHHKELRVMLQNQREKAVAWEQIPIKQTSSRIIYLTDIAKIKYREQLPSAYYRINGLNTINMVIDNEPGINTLKVAGEVKKNMRTIQKSLPPGYSLTVSYDATEYIHKELSKIGTRSLFSALILLFFILLITRQPTYLAVIFFSLLLNLIIAVIFYYAYGLEIHLYSLAGITVSFGIIIDNSIIMVDHFRKYKDRRAFLAILAATLTTIGALSIIFFLKEEQRINLMDFVGVVLINLAVSLFIALFFIPAFLERFPLITLKNRLFMKRKRKTIRFNRAYSRQISFYKRFGWAFTLVALLGFGIPVHWLPEKIEKDNGAARLYNHTWGSEWCQSNLRPVLEKTLGGSLRLFSENIFEKSFYSEPERTKLYVRGSMPEGCTIQQLNVAIEKMENYLSQFPEIEMFETEIYSYDNSSITIFFNPKSENSGFPYILKNKVTTKAISLGGLDWSVYGVGDGFSNALYSGFKPFRIVMEGYNYDALYTYATRLKDNLLHNQRINEVDIAGNISWRGSSNLTEYYLDLDPIQFANHDIYLNQFFSYLNGFAYARSLNDVFDGSEVTPVTLVSDKASTFNSWWLKNTPVEIDSAMVKVSMLGDMGKRKTGNNIYKNNQQYHLVVAWDFIGPPKLGEKVLDENLDKITPMLPLGYKAFKESWGRWDKKDKSQYYLILLVIAIIYFICAILLESLTQPLAIISLIPISMIGVFLTFYLFDINFDQGGFASFIFLAGITVNSGLYIVNSFNNYKKRNTRQDKGRLYIKAFNHKIVPVLLTVASTIIGLLPFVWGGQKEVFWYSFAVGTMGGLVFSLLALYLYFPLILSLDHKPKKRKKT